MQLDTPLRKYIKPVPKVLETCTLDKILPLIKSGNPFLLVVDEHGGTEGLITSADLTKYFEAKRMINAIAAN